MTFSNPGPLDVSIQRDIGGFQDLRTVVHRVRVCWRVGEWYMTNSFGDSAVCCSYALERPGETDTYEDL